MKILLKCVGRSARGGVEFQIRDSSFGLSAFTVAGEAIVGRDYEAEIVEAKEQTVVVGDAKGKDKHDPSPASVVIPGEGPAFQPFRGSHGPTPEPEPADEKKSKKK